MELLSCESYYDLPSTRARRTTTMGYGNKDIGLSPSRTPGAGTYDLGSCINPESHKYDAVAFGFGRDVRRSSCRKWNWVALLDRLNTTANCPVPELTLTTLAEIKGLQHSSRDSPTTNSNGAPRYFLPKTEPGARNIHTRTNGIKQVLRGLTAPKFHKRQNVPGRKVRPYY
jgi:hypothetical protein